MTLDEFLDISYTPEELFDYPFLLMSDYLKINGDISFESLAISHHFIARLPKKFIVNGHLSLRYQKMIENISEVQLIVSGRLNLSGMNLTKLPDLTMSNLTELNISHNQLSSFKGCPRVILDNFLCHQNRFDKIDEYFPEVISGYITCDHKIDQSLLPMKVLK